MKYILLTSSPTGPLDGSRSVENLDVYNGFVEKLKAHWCNEYRLLMIAATSDDYHGNDEMIEFFQAAFWNAGLYYSTFDLLDDRYFDIDIHNYDVIVLAGGHVPTENNFFSRLDLRNRIKDYEGMIIGISAGSMNCADIVYCQPELAGESKSFKRYLKGLNLTDTQIIPHYQMVKDKILDGKRLFEQITYLDSYIHPLLALTDGAYLEIDEDGKETVHGLAYKIDQGVLRKYCAHNESKEWEN